MFQKSIDSVKRNVALFTILRLVIKTLVLFVIVGYFDSTDLAVFWRFPRRVPVCLQDVNVPSRLVGEHLGALLVRALVVE